MQSPELLVIAPQDDGAVSFQPPGFLARTVAHQTEFHIEHKHALCPPCSIAPRFLSAMIIAKCPSQTMFFMSTNVS